MPPAHLCHAARPPFVSPCFSAPPQADLLDFYDRHFSLGGAGRRKLSTWVFGNQYALTTATAVAPGEEDAEESGGQGGGGAAGTVKEEAVVVTEACAGADGAADGGSGGGGRVARKVVVVDDCTAFKRSMPLLPLRKPTPVKAVDLEQSKL